MVLSIGGASCRFMEDWHSGYDHQLGFWRVEKMCPRQGGDANDDFVGVACCCKLFVEEHCQAARWFTIETCRRGRATLCPMFDEGRVFLGR